MSAQTKIKLIVQVLYFIFFPLAVKTQTDSHLRKEIWKIIQHDTDISFEKIPGFILGIIDHDSVYMIGFGTAEKGSDQPVSDTSKFQIGGLTKVFTAHLCQILYEKNILSYEKLINEYLPDSFQNLILNKISILDLLTHTSGLQGPPENIGTVQSRIQDPYHNYSRQHLSDYLKNITALNNHQTYHYAHINYALIEIILEHITGQSFKALMDTHIFRPAGMIHSAIDDHPEQLTPGYDRTGRKTPPWNFRSFRASEGVVTTCRDLCRYLQAQLLSGQPVSFHRLLPPRHKIEGTKKTYTATGWHLFKNRKASDLYLHSGKTDAHAASIHFITDTKTAVILLANSPGKMDGLATLVLRMLNDNWKRKS
jgi:serine-type D-Ala-D-Ala carboxypeptidase/endopeptidase